MTNKEEEFTKRLEAESKEREYEKWKKENDPIEIKKIQKENNYFSLYYFFILTPLFFFMVWWKNFR
jgi:hypothetical protein